jgi:alkaline phosphatase D
MNILKYMALAVFAAVIFSSCSNLKPERDKPYVVLVSLDAFRWDYDSIHGTPVLDDIARKGVVAERLIPSFPTKTFPNQ